MCGAASLLALALGGGPARAQVDQATAPQAEAEPTGGVIIVTAQRQAESLQSVPIAVSALSGRALEQQQIDDAADLQLSLPNVTFTKTNFTTSSFTIRGIGDLCTGATCDLATAVHLDGTPLLSTRLFETEFYDLERLEVLRGPQGTLFGRNATSGVVNFIPARPNLARSSPALEAEYGNFDSFEAKGMVNFALSETVGVRLAGFYQNRGGYTRNVFDGRRVDGRDVYSVRGTVRFEPTDTTTIDLLASYFHENDSRLRILKQFCQRDPTGVLGCLNQRREYGTVNNNSTFFAALSSRELFALSGVPAPLAAGLGLGSVYDPTDAYAGSANPADLRTLNTDFRPRYFSDEEQYQARIEQELGSLKLQLTGFYHTDAVDSREDYVLGVQNRARLTPALTTLAAAAAGAIPGLPAAYFEPLAAALIPDGPAGNVCTSQPEKTGTGLFGGHALCAATPQSVDRSSQKTKDWSVEAILTSDYDGRFNFLLGGIYANQHLTDNSYYVSDFGIDYASAILGAFGALSAGIPPAYLGPPFFRNDTDDYRLKSFGIFAEGYYELTDKLKLTLGARYNSDKKSVRARSPLLSFEVPFAAASAFASPFSASFDADEATPGVQAFQERRAKFTEWTGRTVLDYQITRDNLLYASYSRGYKSGGINPPLQPIFAVPDTFAPEFVDAFEIGSKNVFDHGRLTLNLTGFYYKYDQLQLSRIVARTSVNDNVSAEIYGVEAEAIVRPIPRLTVNIGASYLHSKVTEDKFLANPRDPSGGRSDAVIIKDVTNAANCAVVPTTAASGPAVNAYVGAVNSALGLQPPMPLPADSGVGARTGAFGVCSALQGAIADPSPALRAAFATPTGALPFAVANGGVPVNIRGRRLPQAPTYKLSVGAQYEHEFANSWSIVPRVDLSYTGHQQTSIFGGDINRIKGFVQMNAQMQLDGPDDRWFVRAFVSNLFDTNALTGLYVADASTGLFTNAFSLDPRRYGLGAGVKF